MKVRITCAGILMGVLLAALLLPAPALADGPAICSTPNLAIPDAAFTPPEPGLVTDTITLAETGTITDLNVSILATHDWVGDLSVTLSHVDTGSSVTLIDRPGVPPGTFGCGSDDIAATLDDEAATSVEDACNTLAPAISGVFTPNNPLSVFDGEDISGTWQLTVSDNAALSVGTLDQWCLIPAPQADLAVSKTVDQVNPTENELLNYAVTVSDNGPDEATGVVISDTLPVGVTFTSANSSQGNYSSATGLWQVGSLLVGQSATLTLAATVDGGTFGQTITNTAEVSASDQLDLFSNNNTAEAAITVAVTDLRLDKRATRTTAPENGLFSYRVTVSNDGPNGATGVVVSDTLPVSVTLVASTTSQGSYDSSAGVWELGDLAASASAILTLTATVNEGTAGQTITNTATISTANQFDPVDSNNTDNAVIRITNADLALNKTVDDPTPKENDLLSYTITVLNNGLDGATGVVISDTLPVSLTFNSASLSQGSYNISTGVWNVEKLLPSQAATLTLTATVQAGTAGQTITNTATISASEQSDSNSSNNLASVPITVTNADLAVSKTADNPSPKEGGALIYTVSVTNNGPDDTSGVVISDTLPLSITLVSSSTSQGNYDSSAGTWQVGDLSASTGATLTLTTTVQAGTAGQTITNTATVSTSNQPDADLTNNTDDAVVTVSNADLAVSKTVDQANPNETEAIVYTVVVNNNGPDEATGVVISDTLPLSVSLVTSSTSQGNYDSSAGLWQLSSLLASESATLTLTAEVNSGTAGQTITNTAEVSLSDQTDPIPINNTASIPITVTNADLVMSKTVDNSNPEENELFSYTVSVSNNGPDEATSVVISETLPLSISLVSSSTTQGSYNSNAGAWQVGNLPINQSAALTLTVTAEAGTAGQTITNTAQVGAVEQGDSNSSNNTADAAITVVGANLSISKIDLVDPVAVGSALTYTVVVTNSGPSTATGVVMTDALPATLNFVSVSPGLPTCAEAGGAITCTLDTLNNGATTTVTIVVTSTTVGTVTNTANVIGNETDPTPADNIATAETIIGAAAPEETVIYLPVIVKED